MRQSAKCYPVRLGGLFRGAAPCCFAGPLSEWDVALGGASLTGRRPNRKSRLMVSEEEGRHGYCRKWWSPATRRCSRWYALHLHPCSRSCGSRAGNLRDPTFDDRFLKALATREAERVPCLPQ